MTGTAAASEKATGPAGGAPPRLGLGSLQNLHDTLHALALGEAPDVEPEGPPQPVELSRPQLRAFAILSRTAPEECLAQFRLLRGRLLRWRESFEGETQRLRTLCVSSAVAGEGKTFVALNLGLMLAVAPGRRVLVVEANVDAAQYAQQFGLPGQPGLREVIAGLDWRAAAGKVPDLDLFVMALGARRQDAMEPLAMPALKAWLGRVREEFDWVLLDGPPLEESPEAEALAYLADGALLVLDPEHTRASQVSRALERVNPACLAGVVFNRRPAAVPFL